MHSTDKWHCEAVLSRILINTYRMLMDIAYYLKKVLHKVIH